MSCRFSDLLIFLCYKFSIFGFGLLVAQNNQFGGITFGRVLFYFLTFDRLKNRLQLIQLK